jgi:hypothetical protein
VLAKIQERRCKVKLLKAIILCGTEKKEGAVREKEKDFSFSLYACVFLPCWHQVVDPFPRRFKNSHIEVQFA